MRCDALWLQEFCVDLCQADTINRIISSGRLAIELSLHNHMVLPASCQGVLVAYVVSVERHPNADRLKICWVRTSDQNECVQVVCGAPNVRKGLYVAFAPVGASLPHMTIEKRTIRGVRSCGMLCSEQELTGKDISPSSGILELPEPRIHHPHPPQAASCEEAAFAAHCDADVLASCSHGLLDCALKLGDNFSDYMRCTLFKKVIHAEITPNRGDCASVLGIARECASVLKRINCGSLQSESGVIHPPVLKWSESHPSETTVAIDVKAQTDCPYYVGCEIHSIDWHMPDWMSDRLRISGYDSIHPLVDLSHYVMLEFGQPFHLFDLASLSGNLSVRFGYEGEYIQALNGQKYLISEDILVVADQSGPQAIAGLIGAQATAVSDETHTFFIECAHFCPETIARASRHFRLTTQAAYRFERGVDYLLPIQAMRRFLYFLNPRSCLISSYPHVPIDCTYPAYVDSLNQILSHVPHIAASHPSIVLHNTYIKEILGYDWCSDLYPMDWAVQGGHYLESNCVECTSDSRPRATCITLSPPSYRFDLKQAIDWVEEIVKLQGYPDQDRNEFRSGCAKRTPSTTPNLDFIRQIWINFGYQEMISYTFSSSSVHKAFRLPTCWTVLNPMNEHMDVMRTSLWPGLLRAVCHNVDQHQSDSVRFFECGPVFIQGVDGQSKEISYVSGIWYGRARPCSWAHSSRNFDFFDLKGQMEQFLSARHIQADWKPTEHPSLAWGLDIWINEICAGSLGILYETCTAACNLKEPPYVFEWRLDVLSFEIIPKYHAFSKFPCIIRDLNFVVPIDCTMSEIDTSLSEFLKQNSVQFQSTWSVVDRYCGSQLPGTHHSLTFRFVFQALDRTLLDEEVQIVIDHLIQWFDRTFKATLRAS